MPDTKLSDLVTLGAEPAASDELMVNDISDTTMAASGTNKNILWSTIKAVFALASHNHAASDVNSGQLILEQGGTESDLSATGPGVLQQASSGAIVTVGTTLDGMTLDNVKDFITEAATTLTIATGAVTATQMSHLIDTESAAASDDLDTISGGSADERIVIRAANTARTVVIKHGTGNIQTSTAADVSLDNTEKIVELFYDGTNWIMFGDGGGGGGGADTSLSNLSGVAVNTDIISDTDSTDSLGSTAIKWLMGWFDRLTLGEGSAAGTPAAGDGVIYVKSTDSLLYFKNDGGTEYDLTAGAAGGETNTASDGGTGGIGIVLAKSGVDLPFKGIAAGSSKVSVTNDAVNDNVDIDVTEANLTLDNLGGTLDETKGGTGQSTITAGDILYGSASNILSKLAAGTNGHVLTLAAGVPSWAAGGGGSVDVIWFTHEETSGTDGGTKTGASWETRTINTEKLDPGGHASVSSNVITLAAGTYQVVASAAGYRCNSHKIRLQNTSDATTVAIGSAEESDTSSVEDHSAMLTGAFVIAASKNFELQHYSTSTRATDGMGKAYSWGTEVYASITFLKIG